MTSQIVSAIKGTVIRAMLLDVCGNPITGAGSAQVVEAGFISVKPAPQYEDGNEYLQKRADGVLCINQKDQAQLKRVELDELYCVLNPDLMVMMSGARLLNSGGASGTGAIWNDSVLNVHVSVEIWQQVSGRNACSASGQQQYVYWAFPHVQNGQIGDWTIEANSVQWDMKQETASAGIRWGGFPTLLPPNGYLVGAGLLQLGDQMGYNVTTVAPPSPTFGAIQVT
jgi:hypothetical protein